MSGIDNLPDGCRAIVGHEGQFPQRGKSRPAICTLVGHSQFGCPYLLLGDVTADRAGEPLPDVVNVGPAVFQPLSRYDLVPSTARFTVKGKGHAGTGKAGDGAYGDGGLVEHWEKGKASLF